LFTFILPVFPVAKKATVCHNRDIGREERGCVRIEDNVAWAVVYLRTEWHLDPSSRLATIDMGRKVGGAVSLPGGAGSPCNSMWPRPRPAFVPSFILIRPTVWPQFTNATHRQDRTNMTTVRRHRANRFTIGRPKMQAFPPLLHWTTRLTARIVVCVQSDNTARS